MKCINYKYLLLVLIPILMFPENCFSAGNQAAVSKDNQEKYYKAEAEKYRDLGLAASEQSDSKAMEYFNKSIACFRKMNDKSDLSLWLMNYGGIYIQAGLYSEAEQMLLEGLDLAKKLKKDSYIIFGYSLLGANYSNQGRYREALGIYEHMIERHDYKKLMAEADSMRRNGRELSHEEIFYFKPIILLYNNYALLLDIINKRPKAIELGLQAYNIANRINESETISVTSYNLIKYYIENEDYPSALKALTKYDNFLVRIKDKESRKFVNFFKANIYTQSGKYQEALNALNTLSEADFPAITDLSGFILTKVECYLKLGNLQNVKSCLDKLNLHRRNLDFAYTVSLFKYYSDYYSQLKDYKTALLYSDTLQKLCDSVENVGNMSELIDQIAISQYQSKMNEIKLLNKKNILINNKVSAGHRIRTLFIILIILIITIITLFLYYSHVRKKATVQIRLKNNELERTNSELAVSNATKDKFFSIIAHDLKNPVGNTKNAIEMLSASYSEIDEREKKEYILMLKDAVDSAHSLLDDLLVWSQSQRNEIEYHPEMIDAAGLAHRTISLQQLSALNKQITLENTVDPELRVFADGKLVMTILRNLVSNSIKFTPEGGKIEIGSKAGDKSGMRVIYVKDNGVGMTPEKQSQLFRVDTNVTTPGTAGEKGTGLGLILCMEFAERNGGKISVRSETGKGSEFYVELPETEDVLNNKNCA